MTARIVRHVLVALVAALLVVSPAPASQAATRECSARTALAARPTLAPGDIGTCVRTLQNLLLTKGYTLGYGWPGGRYDTATTNAVKAMQQALGLPQTGRVQTADWRRLAASRMRPAYSPYRGPNQTHRVVLSYDDCPRSLSSFRSTLREAKRLDIGLVLFPTGSCLRSGRFDAAWARARGHYVFNHTSTHPDLRTLSYSAAYRELGRPGVVTTYGRPPFGATHAASRRAYAARGMRIWLWTYDTSDYTGLSQAQVVRRVVDSSTSSSSVLMHMQWSGFSPAALRSMRSGLAGRGLSVCRNYAGTTPARPTSMRC